MPLHLLSKKSWNVYAPDNIVRVKRDQAAAQAREEEDDRRSQEDDQANRLAVLRGEAPASALQPSSSTDGKADEIKEYDGRGDRRKRKRLHGEDDTDRDLRLAREQLETEDRRTHRGLQPKSKPHRSAAPITDRNGHINLFPVPDRVSARGDKNSEAEAEKAKKQRELEDQSTMRFSNAGGRNGLNSGPWYIAGKDKRHNCDNMEFVEGKDVWGRPDSSAKDREQARQVSNDPFAFMQEAQSQLRQSEKDKRRWKEEEQGRIRESERERHEQKRRNRERERDHSRSRSSRHKERHHRSERSRGDGRGERRDNSSKHRRRKAYEHDEHSSGNNPERINATRQSESLPAIADDFRLDA